MSPLGTELIAARPDGSTPRGFAPFSTLLRRNDRAYWLRDTSFPIAVHMPGPGPSGGGSISRGHFDHSQFTFFRKIADAVACARVMRDGWVGCPQRPKGDAWGPLAAQREARARQDVMR